MVQELLYVYCIYAGPVQYAKDEKWGDTYVLLINGFQVVVKKVSGDDYSEECLQNKIADLHWLDSQVREHVQVITDRMQIGTVIPFKFGTIYKSIASLTQFLEQYSNSLSEQFKYLEDMEEWSVKMYADISIMCNQIDQLSNAAAELENQITTSAPGKAFLLKKKKKVLIEEEVDRICTQNGQAVFDLLEVESAAINLNILQTNEITGRADEMVLNASFLVKKTALPQFKNIITHTLEKITLNGFKIETSGPWPPFSFISIKENQYAS